MTHLAIHAVRGGDELVCRIQTDFGIATPYVLCAPVVRRDTWGPPIPRLHIAVDIDGVGHLVLMTQMVSIPASDLGAIAGSAGAQRDAIVQAVDLLVTGF